MIPRRYAWLLRDESTLFESVGPRGGTWCKLCAAASDAARDAASDALRPTVEILQASALLLLDRMIEVGKDSDVPA